MGGGGVSSSRARGWHSGWGMLESQDDHRSHRELPYMHNFFPARRTMRARACVCVCVCVLVVQSCPTLCHPMDCSSPGSSVHGDSRGKTTGVGCHSLLQGIFPTQGSNPGLLHCRRILCRLSHQGSPECTPDLLCWLLCTPKEGFMGKQEGRQGQENKQNPEC